MADIDRATLFSNENFVIGLLQAVSGAAIIAGLAQGRTLIHLGGPMWFRWYLTAQVLTLLLAILAAYWKHQYKVWDVKAGISADQGSEQQAKKRRRRAARYLGAMRVALGSAVIVLVGGLAVLMVAIWWRVLLTRAA